MDTYATGRLRIGTWCIDPATGQISRDGEVVRVDARNLRLLICLANKAGEAVSVNELLDSAWEGVVVTPDSVYQAVATLRRALGDDAKHPEYIVTVPRLGYRLAAPVSPWLEEPSASAVSPSLASTNPPRRKFPIWVGVTMALALVALAVLLVGNRGSAVPSSNKSVAVLPFLDLTTQAMNEEYFADGMTEELIDRLSKVPGLSVPSPTSSFYFKGKKATVADIARSLGVAYVLDGSIRKSDATLRIAARLVRASDGYVVWSDTYDRPAGDKLKVQEDIASEVTKALRATIN